MTKPNRDMQELLKANPHLQRTWQRVRYPGGVHPWRWRLMFAWVVVFSVLVAWAFHVQGNLIHRGEQAHDSLCALQQNLQLQIAASEKYLRDTHVYLRDVKAGRPHPRGRRPIAGITDNDIQAGIKRSQLTLASLHSLHCEAGKPVPPPHDSIPPPATTVPGGGVTVTSPVTTTTGG